jgi:hypothetical protein
MADFITCPKCGATIPLTDVITHQIEEQLQVRLAQGLEERERQHTEALAEKEVELRKEFNTVQAEHEAELVKRAEKKVATDIADFETRLAEQDEELKQARKLELELRRAQRKLDEDREALDLEVARRIDQERKKVAEDATRLLTEDHRLKLSEKDLQLEQMQKQIKELQESSEQTRAGLRGEVLERDIEDVLRETFPRDTITPVKAGIRGADILQTVRSPRGQDCGKILWESKRAQNWSNTWTGKLKQDQAAAKAEIGVIVSSTLPQTVQLMGSHEGVWVAETSCVVALATALREGLLAVSQARSIDTNKSAALDAIYEYLCSNTFNQRIRTAVQTFIDMKSDLESERRTMETRWSKRAKQLDQLALNTAGMYGELDGIMGPALPPVELLELETGD